MSWHTILYVPMYAISYGTLHTLCFIWFGGLEMPTCLLSRCPGESWLAGWQLACFGTALSKPVHLLKCTTQFSGLRPSSSCCLLHFSSTGSWGCAAARPAGSREALATDQARLSSIDCCSVIHWDACTLGWVWDGMGAGGVVLHFTSTFSFVLLVRAGRLASWLAGTPGVCWGCWQGR